VSDDERIDDERLDALRASVGHLRDLAAPLSDEQLAASAYPSEWSVADVLSHLGSGAVIHRHRLGDVLSHRDTDDGFAPRVWDEWNAKSAPQKRTDGLEADAALLAALEAVDLPDRATFAMPLGPMSFDFATFVGLRVNEHTLHTWDVEVALDPAATLQASTVPSVLDNLGMVAGWAGRPTGETGAIVVRTTHPARELVVRLTPEAVRLEPADADAGTTSEPAPGDELELPAEAFVRLVYGRLDDAHSPVPGSPAIDTLRAVFRGM
jgi:uncharacterized protein (TIGR03083 family)